jgi:hypothetical protein
MNSEVLRGGWERELFGERKDDVAARVLRSQLVNLTLDWELAALALDARRYKASETVERENLRDSAIAYRKCIAELTGILSASSLLACKP